MDYSKFKNPQIELASDFIQFTGKHIFLTGKAGTGKTTFLHHLKKKSPKRMIVVAPTGVAAINAGGVTIHSFFQVSFGPQVQGYSSSEQQGFKKFSREKRNIIKSLDLLVIDEISMVRADLLDRVDETLRRIRNNNNPFGGVQLLMIGDLQQLAPVVKDDEWNLLRMDYQTACFFSSKALQKTQYITIVLHHVYRQSDERFIGLLNQIRDNKINDETKKQLNERFKPDFEPGNENYIILTTHNAKARHINENRLQELKATSLKFEATVTGKFPEYTYPTEIELELKSGAQVMFVKNDPNPDKLYYNGKIGVITAIDEDEIIVQCPDDNEPICVSAIEWQNYKYTIEEETKEINETVEGTFTQIPLKLAWAITIHKSQGLTFDKAIIDSESAFAHGQVYVALSRCRSLEGLVLSSKFSPYSLKHNSTIDNFNREVENNPPDAKQLSDSKAEYQAQLLFDLFTFENLKKNIYRLERVTTEHEKSLQKDFAAIFKPMINRVVDEVITVSGKFRNQIKIYLNQNNNAEKNDELQERIVKATSYFSDKIKELIAEPLAGFEIETDNKEIKRKVSKPEEELLQEINYKMACLTACNSGFYVKDYLVKRALASLEKPKKKRSNKRKPDVSSESSNPQLYELLKNWRNAKATKLGMAVFMVLPLKSMRALSNQVPRNTEELKMVHGIGKKKLDTYGLELIQLLNEFREDHDVVIPNNDQDKKPI